MIALSLLRVIGIVLLAVGWMSVGHALLPGDIRRDGNRSAVWASSLALGCGATAVVLTALAMCGLHGRLWCWVVALLSLFGLRRQLARGAVLSEPRGGFFDGVHDRRERIGWVAIAALMVATLFVTLAPPAAMDATVYHLRAPREIMRAGFWAPMDDVHAYQPLYVEMLFGEGLVIGGGPLAALVHWALGVGATAAAAAWARRLGGRAVWAAVLFAGTGLYVWEATSSFIDLGLALFAALAMFWALQPETRGSTALAGVFAGLAAGTKFTGGIAAGLIGLAAAWTVWPDRRAALRRLLLIGALTFLVAAPWYLRDLILTGNPIYPLANRLFGLPPVTLALLPYGLGRDVLHLLSSPFDVIVRGDAFDQGWSVGPAYLAFVPLAIALRPTPTVRTLAGLMLAWWVVWFFSSPQTRLLVPILPAAAGVASLAVTAAFRSPSRAVHGAAAAVLALAGAGAFGMAALSVKVTSRVVLGLETPADYLRRSSWSYVAYDAANRRLPPEARVSVTGGGNLFYLDREARLAGHELRPAADLLAAGFTHELWIGPCPAPANQNRVRARQRRVPAAVVPGRGRCLRDRVLPSGGLVVGPLCAVARAALRSAGTRCARRNSGGSLWSAPTTIRGPAVSAITRCGSLRSSRAAVTKSLSSRAGSRIHILRLRRFGSSACRGPAPSPSRIVWSDEFASSLPRTSSSSTPPTCSARPGGAAWRSLTSSDRSSTPRWCSWRTSYFCPGASGPTSPWARRH